MSNNPMITPAAISDWLIQEGHTREWLAERTGTSKGTVSGWLASNKPRPIPLSTLKLIERLMCDDLLGEPLYSYEEAKVIRQAMAQEGYMSLRDFIKDAVTANARSIMLAAGEVQGSQNITPMSEWAYWSDGRGGVAAGQPIDSVEWEPVRVPKDYPADHYVLRVFGSSMEPKIPDGSQIVVREWRDKGFPKRGTIVVYSDGTGATLKVFDYRAAKEGDENANAFGQIPVLKSLNPQFREVQTMDGGRIDAVFVEVL